MRLKIFRLERFFQLAKPNTIVDKIAMILSAGGSLLLPAILGKSFLYLQLLQIVVIALAVVIVLEASFHHTFEDFFAEARIGAVVGAVLMFPLALAEFSLAGALLLTMIAFLINGMMTFCIDQIVAFEANWSVRLFSPVYSVVLFYWVLVIPLAGQLS